MSRSYKKNNFFMYPRSIKREKVESHRMFRRINKHKLRMGDPFVLQKETYPQFTKYYFECGCHREYVSKQMLEENPELIKKLRK